MRKGHHHSKEARRKNSEAHIGKYPTDETRRKLSLTSRGRKHTEETKRRIGLKNKGNSYAYGHRHSEEVKRKISLKSKKHSKLVRNEVKKYQEMGYRVLNGDLKPRPDIIATKDGKVIAIEVEMKPECKWNKKKYDGITFFDDIIWINRR